MPQTRILAAHSNAQLLQKGAEFIGGLGNRGEFVVLAPSRGAGDDFLRNLAGSGLAGGHALTLTQLAASLASPKMSERGLVPVSWLGQEALAARAVHHARKQEAMHYFEPVADTPGFVRALAATLSELRLDGVNHTALRDAGAPGKDLSALLTHYSNELELQSLADHATVLEFAGEAAMVPHRYLGIPLLLLDLPVRHQLEQRLLAAVAKTSTLILAVSLGSDEESLSAIESCLGASRELLQIGDLNTLDRVRHFVFASDLPPTRPFDKSVDYFSAPGESLECVEIARRIRQLAFDGMPFDSMAIVLRAGERYQPLVEEALRRAGVEAYFHRGTARPDPAGRAFLALLACAAEGLTASRFAEYLSLAQVPNLDERGAPVAGEVSWVPAQDEVLASFSTAGEAVAFETTAETPAVHTPANWEALLVDAAVVGGSDRWHRRLEGLDQELRLQLGSLKISDEERPRIQRRIEELQALRNYALPLIEQMPEMGQQASWGEWIENLSKLAVRSLRRPESVLAMLNELEPMKDVGPVSLNEVYGVLEDRLRFLRNDPPHRRYGRVFICSPEEVRGREFAVVFLPGLAEGVFPRRALEDPLLLDTHRAKAAAHLTRQLERVARERLLLRCAAAAAIERLVVSYPRMDVAQGRPRVPSFYALEILRAGEGRLPDLREFEKHAAEQAAVRLGRPAPQDPKQALDDAEYDLSQLDLAMQQSPEEARGSMRYLVEVSPVLARSLRTRYRRWSRAWSGADGIVEPGLETLRVLKNHWLDKRCYSPTALEKFAACPYKFLLHAIHFLRPREQSLPLEQMDPLTRGALFHAVQKALWDELDRLQMFPLSREKLPRILDAGDRVLDTVARKYEDELAPAIPRVWVSEVEDLRTDFRGWLRHISGEVGWLPILSEYSFGLKHSEKPEVYLLEALRLRGSIDLVEQNIQTGLIRVTDHKTGKPPDVAPAYVGNGTVLQPLLYALALEQLLDKPVGLSRLFYCTQRGQYREMHIQVNEHARSRISLAVEVISAFVINGFLPAAPKADACSQCDYRPVCGPYEEQRVRQKDQSDLEGLFELRRIP